MPAKTMWQRLLLTIVVVIATAVANMLIAPTGLAPSPNPNRIGNGTTMDAIRNELATGVPTAGRMHPIKGQKRLNGLNKWLHRSPDASYHDRLVAQSLADELSLVLRGGV